MEALLAFFRSKNITSHTVAAAVITLAGLIMSDEQVRDFVLSTFQAHPKIGTSIVALAGIVLKYSHSSSSAGTIATAEKIVAAPNPPTPAEVDAAKGTKP